MIAVLRREWISAWRDRRGYWLRGLYAGVLLLVGTSLWVVYGAISAVEEVDFAQTTWEWMRLLAAGQFVLVTALGAVVCARTVVQEKESGALELLLLSRLSAMEILAAKALSELVEAAFVLVAGLPVLVFFMVFGGISAADLASIHVLLMAQLAFVAAVAIGFAVFFERFPPVMAATVGTIVGVAVATELRTPPAWVDAMLPYRVMQADLRAPGAQLGSALASLAAMIALLAAVVAGASVFLERRVLTSPGRGLPMSRGRSPSRLAGRVASWWPVRALFGVRWRGRNPMLERDGRIGERGRLALAAWYAMYAAVAGVILVRGLAVYPRGAADEQVMMSLCGLGAAAVAGTIAAAVSIAAEKRRGVTEVLLGADVDPREIVDGKLAGALLVAGYVAVPALAQLWGFVWFADLAGSVGMQWRATFALPLALAAGVPWGMAIASRGRGGTYCAALGVVAAVFSCAAAAAVAAFPSVIAQGVFAAMAASWAFALYAIAVRSFRRNAMR
jgi:ABC-type Na+ efflux pump permease subunit